MDEDVGGDKVYQHVQSTQPKEAESEGVTAPGPSEGGSQDPCTVGSTSSLTLKLNKHNCESGTSISDEPKPGPSNSAADFDLEVRNHPIILAPNDLHHFNTWLFITQVFDSGSSCSNEECWELDKEGSKVKVSTVQSSLATSSSSHPNPINNSQKSDKVRTCGFRFPSCDLLC